jgi:hypothetical protein
MASLKVISGCCRRKTLRACPRAPSISDDSYGSENLTSKATDERENAVGKIKLGVVLGIGLGLLGVPVGAWAADKDAQAELREIDRKLDNFLAKHRKHHHRKHHHHYGKKRQGKAGNSPQAQPRKNNPQIQVGNQKSSTQFVKNNPQVAVRNTNKQAPAVNANKPTQGNNNLLVSNTKKKHHRHHGKNPKLTALQELQRIDRQLDAFLAMK